jgi:hypothetical protein
MGAMEAMEVMTANADVKVTRHHETYRADGER